MKYNQVVETILRVKDQMTAPLTAINSKLKSSEKAISKMQGGLSKTQSTLTSLGAAAVGGLMVKGLKDAIGVGMQFDKVMTDVVSKLGFNRGSAEFERLSKAASDVAANSIFSAREAAGALDFLAMAGYNTVDALEGALGKTVVIAQAAGLTLDRTVDIVSDLESMTKHLGYDMERVGDIFVKAGDSANTTFEGLFEGFKAVSGDALEFGMSVEQLTASLSLLADKGIKGGEAGNKLKRIMVNLKNPVGAGAKAIANYGLATTDAAGNMLDFSDILRNMKTIYDDLGGTGSQVAQAFLSDIAGSEAGSALAMLLQTGGDALDDFTNMLEDSGGAAAAKAAIMGQSTAALMAGVGSKWEGLQLKMFQALSGGEGNGLDGLLMKLTDNLPVLESAFTSMGKAAGMFFNVLGVGAVYLAKIVRDIAEGPKWIKVLITVLGVLIPVLGVVNLLLAMNPFIAIAMGIIVAIVAVIAFMKYFKKLPMIFKALFSPIYAWVKLLLWSFMPIIWIFKALIFLLKGFVKGFAVVGKGLGKGLGATGKAFGQMFGMIGKAFAMMGKVIWAGFVWLIKAIAKGAVWLFKMVWAGIKVYAKVATWLVKTIFAGVVWLFKMWAHAWVMVIGLIVKGSLFLAGWVYSYLIMPLVNMFKFLWDGLKTGLTWAWNGLKAIFSIMWGWVDQHVVQPIAAAFSFLWDALTAGATVLWDGLKAGAIIAVEAIQNIFFGLLNFIDEKVLAPISAGWDRLWGKFKKDKADAESEIDRVNTEYLNTIATQQNVNVSGHIDVTASGGATINSAQSNNKDVPLNDMNKGEAHAS